MSPQFLEPPVASLARVAKPQSCRNLAQTLFRKPAFEHHQRHGKPRVHLRSRSPEVEQDLAKVALTNSREAAGFARGSFDWEQLGMV